LDQHDSFLSSPSGRLQRAPSGRLFFLFCASKLAAENIQSNAEGMNKLDEYRFSAFMATLAVDRPPLREMNQLALLIWQ